MTYHRSAQCSVYISDPGMLFRRNTFGELQYNHHFQSHWQNEDTLHLEKLI